MVLISDMNDEEVIRSDVNEEEDRDVIQNVNVQASSSTSQVPQLLLTNTPDTPDVGDDNMVEGIPRCPQELKPQLSMTFPNLEAGLNFYKEYAKACGFTSRLDFSKVVNGITTHKGCVCNKEGSKAHEGTKRKRSITRVKCGAMIRFRRLETGKYEVYHFVEGHCHTMVSPATMVHLKPCRDLNFIHKKMIMANSRVNRGPVQTYRMFKEWVMGYANVGASLVDFKNFSRDVKKFIKDYDAQMLIENFMQKKAMSPSFYFDFEVDDDKQLEKVFWADPVSIKNYALFGDAVSFDATYDFNKYKMVFTPFTGVDNHKRCVTFAAGLIAKENGESFTWLFQNFVKVMGGCYPITLITDQCRGIKQAVKDVLDGKTHHRYCMWHIMKKLPEKVGPSICQDTDFLKEINSIVWDGDIEPEEFDSKWNSIISSNSLLSENEWLKDMFDIRASWIPSYFRDTYLGGIMRTTSRSESENSFFGNFTNPHLSLVEFLMRFQTAMDAQRWKYAKLMADDKNSSPKLETPLHLEKKVAEFYTTTMFYEFQEEILAACFTCGLSTNATVDGDHISIMDRERDKVYKVDLSNNKLLCSCKMFERVGLLCRHILWVLKDRGINDIPKEYLLDRWSKYATIRPIFNVVGTSLLTDCDSIENRKNSVSELWSAVFTSVSLVENNEEEADELLEMLRTFNEKLMISSKHSKSKDKQAEIEVLIGSKIPNEVSVFPPKQCKNKGSGKRIMSTKEKAKIENSKALRKCRACGEMTHHDFRNCPTRVPPK